MGPKHPETLTSLWTLATLQYRRGMVELSAKLLTEVVSGFEEQLGPEHPDTVAAKEWLRSVGGE